MTSFNKIYGRAFTNRQSLLDVMNKNEPVKLKIIKTRDSDFKNFDEYNNKINPFTRRSNSINDIGSSPSTIKKLTSIKRDSKIEGEEKINYKIIRNYHRVFQNEKNKKYNADYISNVVKLLKKKDKNYKIKRMILSNLDENTNEFRSEFSYLSQNLNFKNISENNSPIKNKYESEPIFETDTEDKNILIDSKFGEFDNKSNEKIDSDRKNNDLLIEDENEQSLYSEKDQRKGVKRENINDNNINHHHNDSIENFQINNQNGFISEEQEDIKRKKSLSVIKEKNNYKILKDLNLNNLNSKTIKNDLEETKTKSTLDFENTIINEREFLKNKFTTTNKKLHSTVSKLNNLNENISNRNSNINNCSTHIENSKVLLDSNFAEVDKLKILANRDSGRSEFNEDIFKKIDLNKIINNLKAKNSSTFSNRSYDKLKLEKLLIEQPEENNSNIYRYFKIFEDKPKVASLYLKKDNVYIKKDFTEDRKKKLLLEKEEKLDKLFFKQLDYSNILNQNIQNLKSKFSKQYNRAFIDNNPRTSFYDKIMNKTNQISNELSNEKNIKTDLTENNNLYDINSQTNFNLTTKQNLNHFNKSTEFKLKSNSDLNSISGLLKNDEGLKHDKNINPSSTKVRFASLDYNYIDKNNYNFSNDNFYCNKTLNESFVNKNNNCKNNKKYSNNINRNYNDINYNKYISTSKDYKEFISLDNIISYYKSVDNKQNYDLTTQYGKKDKKAFVPLVKRKDLYSTIRRDKFSFNK